MDTTALYEIYRRYPVVSTDTRNILPGSIFFALSGAHHDGNKFAHEALAKGASYAVVSDPQLTGDQYILVDDTVRSLQLLANFHRKHFNIPCIAITGSNGKTTTKELVASVLKDTFKVHATTGNFNNHIGVPLTLLSMPGDTEIAVIEMGANHIGEISMLCEIALPTHGLITNIGRAHLEGFGSFEGVRQAKGELFDHLKSIGGHLFVNADDLQVLELGQNAIERTTYGLKEETNAEVQFEYKPDPKTGGFIIHDRQNDVTISSTMFGDYNASNMVAAYTVGMHFQVPCEQIVQRLSSFVPGSNRSEMIEKENCIIVKDAYNANPSSMELALKAFAERFPQGWVVLGAMKELGAESPVAHHHIVHTAVKLGFKDIYLVGREYADALLDREAYHGVRIVSVDTIDELRRNWDWNSVNGNAVLLKGSRSMHLEKLLD